MIDNNKIFWEINSQNILTKHQSRGTPPVTLIEKEYILDFNEKEILHLFCNFGLTSFYLEGLGGKVTGIDYNKHAINFANKRKAELKSKVNFICSDFFKFNSDTLYDIVYGSYGILDWVENIQNFSKIIYNILKPGGKFILIEYHSDFFKLKFEQLNGIEVTPNQFKIPTNFTHRTSTSSLIGGGVISEQPVFMYPFLHNTDSFLETLKNIGFKQSKLKYYDHINFKMGHSMTIGPNKFRNAFLEKGKSMCYGFEFIKE